MSKRVTYIGGPDDGKTSPPNREIVVDSLMSGLYRLEQRGDRLVYQHEHCDVDKMMRGIVEVLNRYIREER